MSVYGPWSRARNGLPTFYSPSRLARNLVDDFCIRWRVRRLLGVSESGQELVVHPFFFYYYYVSQKVKELYSIKISLIGEAGEQKSLTVVFEGEFCRNNLLALFVDQAIEEFADKMRYLAHVEAYLQSLSLNK